jgi:hypothetical protein
LDPEFRPAAAVRSDIEDAFERLKGAPWSIRSPFDRTYKCIAWAACRTDHIWWPVDSDPLPDGVYWPPGIPRNEKLETFVKAFEYLGYRCCDSASFEFGYQKVAIYAWDEDTVTHMARQHFLGNGWLSKPGMLEDIVHPTLESIASDPPYQGGDYGKVFQIMKRSWITALLRLCLFRCYWHSLRFWWYRTFRWSGL